jgi:hypothetical protein
MIEKKLNVWIDLGASSTKIFWSLENDRGTFKGYKAIASGTSECTESAYARARLMDAGTTYVRAGDQYWLVGANATALPHVTISSEPKGYTASVKVLAALGQIMREIPDDLEPALDLKILLPLDEMGQADDISDRVARLAYEFGIDGTETGFRSVRIVEVFPEGYGLIQWVTKDPAMVLVFGHRDVTALHIEAGSIVKHKSKTFAGFGMLNLLKQTDYPLKDELAASAAIFKAGAELDGDCLKKICIASDLPLLKSAIKQARVLAWNQIVRQLQDTGFSVALQVLATGGNAHYWEAELKAIAPGKVSLCKAQIKEMVAAYNVPKNSLMYRSLDAYGLSILPARIGGLVNV